jgi:hypothetical protein
MTMNKSPGEEQFYRLVLTLLRVIFKWEQNSLSSQAYGSADFDKMKSRLDDSAVMFVYMRIPIGAERRNKFVFIRWVGENVRPVQRARAFDDAKRVTERIKVRLEMLHIFILYGMLCIIDLNTS